jgi:protein O-GlcNAc transferase
LQFNPQFAPAHFNLGNALLALQHHQQAVGSYDRALTIKPDFAEAPNNRGNALLALGRHQEALASYDRALAIKPDFAEALNDRGTALFELGRHEEALASYDRALAIKPDFAEALSNRAIVLLALQRHEEALASYDRALTLQPDLAEVLGNRGNALLELQRHEEALASHDRALAIKPNFPGVLSNRGNALLTVRRYEEATKAFERLVSIEPKYDYARGKLLYSNLHCCDWDDYNRDVELITSDVIAGKRAIAPLEFLAVSVSPRAQLQSAQTFCRAKYPASGYAMWKGERYRHDKIRVAYLSADFCDHPMAHLMVELFETHDKSRFETAAISFGPAIKSDIRTRLENSFTRFVDVRKRSDREIALVLRELEIDIAIDLMGYTSSCRAGIFSLRPAPIQVNYLGYPGTMGADYIDYIFADPVIIPQAEHSFYTEKVVYLPDTYLPNDSKRRISDNTPTRVESGLPETGFVFCSFNSNYKIAPPVFDVWMRLLDQVDGSVLWLVEGGAAAVRNLRRNAERGGVAPHRQVFAPRLKVEDHLARQRVADLFLDTLPYNAHTTASDALWAGLPVVTCLGSSFAGRVAASLLNAVGLPELIANNPKDYEALALNLRRSL